MRLINGVRKSEWPAVAARATGMWVLRASRLEVSPGVRVIVHALAARSVRPKQPAGAGTGEVQLCVRSSAFGILSKWKGVEKRGDCLVRPPLGRRKGRTGAERPGKMPLRLPRHKWDVSRCAMPGARDSVFRPPLCPAWVRLRRDPSAGASRSRSAGFRTYLRRSRLSSRRASCAPPDTPWCSRNRRGSGSPWSSRA